MAALKGQCLRIACLLVRQTYRTNRSLTSGQIMTAWFHNCGPRLKVLKALHTYGTPTQVTSLISTDYTTSRVCMGVD